MADFDFSTLITDRSASDLELLRDLLSTPMSDWTEEQLAEFNLARSKGAYNYTDLNRVTAAMDYLNDELTRYGYATSYKRIEIPHVRSRLPDGYTELEYIESTGTQYIDTGIFPDNNTLLKADFQLTSNYTSGIFGARVSISGPSFVLWSLNSTQYRVDYSDLQKSPTVDTLARQSVVFGKTKIQINDFSDNFDSSTFSVPISLIIFSLTTNGVVDKRGAKMRLYSLSIENASRKQIDYVPCKNEQGTVGLYDLVTETFFENLGTGTFSEGPVVENDASAELDPYLWYESDIPTVDLLAQYIANVKALRFVLEVWGTTPPVPDDMEGLTYQEANNIEQILVDVETVITSMSQIFLRAGTSWANSGGPNFYFAN